MCAHILHFHLYCLHCLGRSGLSEDWEVSSVTEPPKAPRWINTEAGLLAWREHTNWRSSAINALSVQERTRLLDEAERLRLRSAPTQ